MIILRKTFFIALLIGLVSVAVAGDLQVADSLGGAFQYDKAITLYKQLVQADSSDAGLLLKLGANLNNYAELQPESDQLKLYEEAYQVLKKSESIDSSNAEIHFQIARTQGRVALYKGIWNSIGLAKEVKREAETALVINPQHDGAMHILGRWHREASNKPQIIRAPLGLGAANKADAVRYLDKAVELRPDYISHHLELGKTYISIDKYPEARNQLFTAILLKVQRPIDERYIEEAKKLLKEIEGKS
ncbi:MAG: hypothetical protein CO189_05130 [candidate division Zixibacteria bacterium CG_4_9_14_3_um_filter_46_8]|nr:MAG: hypothetical protein CO189_05130 [candidate division Zixibacteria bacterium CG_4_9_14_3_um_filter_46_8]